MTIRSYDEDRDLKAIERIWFECGWLENSRQAAYLKDFLAAGDCLTATIDDTAECAVHVSPGAMQYLDGQLELCAVTAVTTSRVARKQGFARQLTARQLARGAGDGAEIAALGMFEQGFYDQLGFGTGSYEHEFTFDPATLTVDVPCRPPSRLDRSNWRDIHASLVKRLRGHGGCALRLPGLIKAELGFSEDGFGLGYFDGSELTHFFWGEPRGEHGPYRIHFLAYRDAAQLMELLALMRSLGDQVSSIILVEPPQVQLQDLLDRPFRARRNTRASAHANQHRSIAFWQARVLDVEACVAARHWPGDEVDFNLVLTDPLSEVLAGEAWSGVAGEYVVRVGADSSARPGHAAGLPVLHAGVGAFTRLLMGVVCASALALSDELAGPAELLARLDEAFCLPPARTTWDF